VEEVQYKAWGESLAQTGSDATRRKYTGQVESEAGLYFYNARYYDPALSRFAQADTLVPNPGNPLAWDRYAYTNNNPIKNSDPTGHWVETALDIAFIAYDIYDIKSNGLTWVSGLSLAADVAGAVLPVVTGAGLAVRALSHADDVTKAVNVTDKVIDAVEIADKADDVVDSGDLLYRSMITAEDGLPQLGESARELGARVPQDIVPVNGRVLPKSGGMSVSPNGPYNLPEFRRPSDFGGTGKDPVWCLSTCDLGPDLSYRPDPNKPATHGFIEPAYQMPYSQYQQALYNTRSKWQLAPK